MYTVAIKGLFKCKRSRFDPCKNPNLSIFSVVKLAKIIPISQNCIQKMLSIWSHAKYDACNTSDSPPLLWSPTKQVAMYF